MRLVFAGTPVTALPSLSALLNSAHQVVAVLTRPDAHAGRGRHTSASPVARLAREAGVEVLTPARPADPGFLSRLTELRPQLCPVVAYGGLLPRSALAIPERGWVNLHFSLLPAWRGAAPVQRAILAGDDVTGATAFLIEHALDTGPILGTMTETIRPNDTAGRLLERLATGGANLLVAIVDAVANGVAVPVPQPQEGISYAPKVTVDDARVRWDHPAVAVDRQVRACTPKPGAWTTFRGERVKLDPVEPWQPVGGAVASAAPPTPTTPPGAGGLDPLPAGAIRADKATVLVGTGTAPVRLTTVQPAGRRPMPAADWARGVRIRPDEAFAFSRHP
ncbi:MAG TPA: methionyl-tRNA formyltransferase [Dermatophilaceae bacterium]|nr:methionyl-tRNA formyltransferase [Dermatophilaceae bacterium]